MRTALSILVLLAVLVPLALAMWRLAASPAVRAVYWRNVKSYFSGVLGYLFIVVFVVAASLLAFNQQFFTNNLATLDQLSQAFPLLLLFLIPAITMTAWSEERKLGTDELLFTLPASDLDILIGKYLSVLSVYTVTLGFSITNLYVLARMGNPDWGPVFTTDLGYWLAGAALLAAGLLTSALTSSATVAFVLGVVLCAVPVFIDRIPHTFFGLFELPRETVASLSIGAQLRDFSLGMIPLTGVLYFVSLASFMLYLNYIVIRKRHWSGGEQTGMGAQYLVRGIAVAVALVGLNVLADGGSARADLTEHQIYSLSPTTRRVIAEMDKKRPVTIQAFVSPNVPREYVPVRKRLLGLLRQYDEIGQQNIETRVVDVEPFSEQADEAAAFGIEPRSVLTIRDGRQIREDIFMGLVFTSSYDEVVIPTLGPGSLIEYELTRSLGTVSKADRLTVGVLQTDANVIGNQSDWEIVRELRLQYDVESVAPAALAEGEYDVLLAVMPSSLTEEDMTHFVDYVKAGNPTLIFDDPYPLQLNPPGRINVAPALPKPSPGGMFGRQQPPEPKADGGKLTSLLDYLNISWTHDGILWSAYNPHPGFGESVPQEYLFFRNRTANPEAISSKSKITRGLQEVLLAYAGEVRNRADSPYEYTPLLVTGPTSGIIPWEQFAIQSFNPLTFSPGFAVNPSPLYETDPAVHAAAALIEGAKKNGPHVVFVSDIDMISDFFFQLRLSSSDLVFDNVAFILNAIDVLAGDESYLELRKRRASRNTLVAVEEQTSVFRDQLHEQQEEAEKKLDEEVEKRQAQFDKAREEIEGDTTLSSRAREQRLQMALQNETRRLAVFRQEQEKKLEQAKEKLRDQTQRKIQETEDNFWMKAVIIPPLPAMILGLSVLLVRMLRERREIDPERMVQHK